VSSDQGGKKRTKNKKTQSYGFHFRKEVKDGGAGRWWGDIGKGSLWETVKYLTPTNT
jgi:hypothetical protein